jgi:toxin CcdB
MSQFDVFVNGNPATHKRTPLLLDVQNDFLSDLATRLVVPLREKGAGPGIGRLHPVLHLGDKEYVALVSEMAAVPQKVLGSLFTTAEGYRQEVIAAIDLLITGF